MDQQPYHSWSMHSLVHSHCRTRPSYCQVTSCRYTVGLLCTLLPPSVLQLAFTEVPLLRTHETFVLKLTCASLGKKL